MKLIPTPDQLANAGANVFDQMFRGGLADLGRTPASIIEEKPQCTVYRYRVADEAACRDLPVLLVPPLAAPTLCFDLRRGCSLASTCSRSATRPTCSSTARSATPTASSASS